MAAMQRMVEITNHDAANGASAAAIGAAANGASAAANGAVSNGASAAAIGAAANGASAAANGAVSNGASAAAIGADANGASADIPAARAPTQLAPTPVVVEMIPLPDAAASGGAAAADLPAAIPAQPQVAAGSASTSITAAEAAFPSAGEGEAICAICQFPLQGGGEVEALGCGHAFHSDCINSYAMHRSKPKYMCCPLKCNVQANEDEAETQPATTLAID